MAQRADGKIVSSIVYPKPIEGQINPPGFKEKQHYDYHAVREVADLAEEAGFKKGAIVVKINPNHYSAAPYYWGMVLSTNRTTPAAHTEYPGPVVVAWVGETHTGNPRVAKHWPDELYIVRRAPSQEEISQLSKQYEAEVKGRGK